MIEPITNFLAQSVNCPHILILSTVFITYGYVLFKGGHVSDDHQGIEQYDGTLIYPVEDKDGNTKNGPDGKVIKARKISYGTLSKWVRYHLCGGHFPSRHVITKADKTTEPIESGKISTHHHLLSVILHAIACLLLYRFLLTVTTPTVALMTVLLFTAHPTGVQAVAWPSAIGYILSLICICSTILIAQWASVQHDWLLIAGLFGVTFFQVWGVYAQGIPLTTGLILIFLGQWQIGLMALAVAAVASFINLGGYVTHRKEEFKKQQMAQSIHFNLRKPIVAFKTLAYYFYLSILPIRLGLYHEWGFHYDKKMELWDWRAITGLALFTLSAYFLFTSPYSEVRIGILWFYSFIFLFLNWITAQQWVTERYLYISVIGLCLIACLFLQQLPFLYFLILGIMICRTWTHLPTYDNELRFYLSNTWNFPKSEVAYGNLGVAYASTGLSGASSDMWIIASSLNSDYDVPFYNIYSKHKSQAFLMVQNGAYEQGLQAISQCIPMLERVLSCKVIHFPEAWKKELDDLKSIVSNPINFLVGEMNRLENLKNILHRDLYNSKDNKRQEEISKSIEDNRVQIEALRVFLISKGVNIEFNPEKALLSKLTKGGVYGTSPAK